MRLIHPPETNTPAAPAKRCRVAAAPPTGLASSLSPTCTSWTRLDTADLDSVNPLVPTTSASTGSGGSSVSVNRASTVTLRLLAKRKETSVDGVARPDSRAEYAWRLIPAFSARVRWENPAFNRNPFRWFCSDVTQSTYTLLDVISSLLYNPQDAQLDTIPPQGEAA